jgi:hypothetical protein
MPWRSPDGAPDEATSRSRAGLKVVGPPSTGTKRVSPVSAQADRDLPTITVVVPTYREVENLPHLIDGSQTYARSTGSTSI